MPALKTLLFDMLSCLSSAMDLVSPVVVAHQKRTAYIANRIARQMGIKDRQLAALSIGGLMHDCGALSLATKLDALRFDFDLENPHRHSELGYMFLQQFEQSFAELDGLGLSDMVRHHHVSWDNGRGEQFNGREVSTASHIIHLADRVEVLIKRELHILGQVKPIIGKIRDMEGKLFPPEIVGAFEAAAARESFWLDLLHPGIIEEYLREQAAAAPIVQLDMGGLIKLAQVFGHIVDFRSKFTSIHSSGVAAVAQTLAGFAGFSEEERLSMGLAGYLHDLGKLAVPTEVLEKNGPLNEHEFYLIKAHPYHAYRLLKPLPGMEQVVHWVSQHHEALDGKGYPFHLPASQLNLGSRIMQVADVFTALTEDRPYRAGMSLSATLDILDQMAGDGKLDQLVVSLAARNMEAIDHERMVGQVDGFTAYQEFKKFL